MTRACICQCIGELGHHVEQVVRNGDFIIIKVGIALIDVVLELFMTRLSALLYVTHMK